MSVQKTLDQLKTILTEEQFEAFAGSVRDLVETRAQERVGVLLEEERQVFKAQLQSKAEEWLTLAMEEKEHEFKKLLEEARGEYDTRLVEEVKAIESRVLQTIDRVIEEEVDTALPSDIRNNAARAQVYGEIVQRTTSVLEESLGSGAINPSNHTAKIVEENKQLQSELLAMRGQLESATATGERLRVKLFIEHKTEHLPERERANIRAMYSGMSLKDVKAQIDNTFEVLEESRKASVRRPASVAGSDHDGDGDPAASGHQDSEVLVEEERQRNRKIGQHQAAAQVVEEQTDVLTTGAPNLLSAIDHLLDGE